MNLAIILVISLVCLTSKVNASTYSLEDQGTAIYWHNGNSSSIKWGTNYYSAENLAVNSFVVNAMIYENKDNQYYPYLNPGTYAIEFYVFGLGYFYDMTCDNLTSNFQNINNTTGELVSNEIASSCVDLYKTTYLGMDAYRILYKFTYKGNSVTGSDSINELRFTISSNVGFLGSLERGINYGLDISPIQEYTSDLYSLFQQEKSTAKIITNGTAQLQAQQDTNNKLDEQIQQDKEQHDEFMNSDISDEDKELPDDSKYQDYTDTENDLKDKVNEADMSVISIGIDANSSAWVWDTLTRLIQSNSIVFGMFIAILSIGIIKLALGR